MASNGREEIEDDCEPIHAKAITLADEELMNIIKGIDNPANWDTPFGGVWYKFVL